MKRSIFGDSILRGAVMGLGIVIIFGAYVFVKAQVLPGTIRSPFFGPQDEDVEANLGDIPCSWVDWESKRIACENGGSYYLCAAIDVYCDNGVVRDMRSGRFSVKDSGASDYTPCDVNCGTVW